MERDDQVSQQARCGRTRAGTRRDEPVTVWTIGHSTRSTTELLSLLSEHGMTLVVDVRTVPRSRHCPQFSGERLALLCAEAVPWRCHRSLTADALTARGVRVQHIIGPRKAHAHELTPWARVDGVTVTYPPREAG